MSLRHRVLWGSVFVFYVWLFLYSIPVTAKICEQSATNDEQHCATYRVPSFLFIEATKIANDYGAAITALATIAIAAFTWTLKRSTDRLWDAGERQLDHLEDSAERQLRAYIHVASTRVEKVDQPNDRSVTIAVKNYGRTPALMVRFRAGESVREWPLATNLPLPGDIQTGIEPLPPARESYMNIPVSLLSPWEEGELKGGRAGIYAWGRIDYLDVFQRPHWTTFRLVCQGSGLKRGYMHTCPDGNDCA
jgi:hypothetical protein